MGVVADQWQDRTGWPPLAEQLARDVLASDPGRLAHTIGVAARASVLATVTPSY